MSDDLRKFQDHVITMVMSSRDRPWFSMCTVTEACKMIGINDYYQRPTYQLLQRMHCQNYSDMSPELMEEIPKMIREVLTPKQPVKSFFRRLFLFATRTEAP